MKLAAVACVSLEWVSRQVFREEAFVAEVRLSGSDKRALLLWIICGVLGLVFAQRHLFGVFPEAAVDFKVSRNDAQQRARDFVQGLGENLNGYQSSITFQVDDNAKTYLERELGLQEADRLMSSQLNIWFWEVRFFKPLQEEEYKVRVSPAGKWSPTATRLKKRAAENP